MRSAFIRVRFLHQGKTRGYSLGVEVTILLQACNLQPISVSMTLAVFAGINLAVKVCAQNLGRMRREGQIGRRDRASAHVEALPHKAGALESPWAAETSSPATWAYLRQIGYDVGS